jgi:hypothetical protein
MKTRMMVLILALLLTGCARHLCRNCVYGKLTVVYSKEDCTDLPKGEFECKRVRFKPLTIPAR